MRWQGLAIAAALCWLPVGNGFVTDEGVDPQDAAAAPAETTADPAATTDAPATFTISGQVKYKKTGPVDVRLCTEAEFPGTGKCSFTARMEIGSSPGTVPFELKGVPAGVYALRAFQDTNGNGDMDVGMFGPKEPWDLYLPHRPKFHAPRFKDVKFELKGDLVDLALDVH